MFHYVQNKNLNSVIVRIYMCNTLSVLLIFYFYSCNYLNIKNSLAKKEIENKITVGYIYKI